MGNPGKHLLHVVTVYMSGTFEVTRDQVMEVS